MHSLKPSFQLLRSTSNQIAVENEYVYFNCTFDVTGDVSEFDTYWALNFQNGSRIFIDINKSQTTFQLALQYKNITAVQKCGYPEDIP